MNFEVKDSYIKIEFPETYNLKGAIDMIDKTAEVLSPIKKKMNRLYDLRNNKYLELDHDQMRTIIQSIRSHGKNAEDTKSAFIVINQLQFGFLRMFQTMVSDLGIHVGIFFSEEDAVNWISE